MSDTRTADLALVRFNAATDAVTVAREVLKSYERQLDSACVEYTKARPLTEGERDAMAARVKAGHGLCCGDGLKWLRARLPEPWAHALNDWAYGALSCKGSGQYRDEEVAKVKKLKLDRFPGGW
jgi:hypothetical protein